MLEWTAFGLDQYKADSEIAIDNVYYTITGKSSPSPFYWTAKQFLWDPNNNEWKETDETQKFVYFKEAEDYCNELDLLRLS